MPLHVREGKPNAAKMIETGETRLRTRVAATPRAPRGWSAEVELAVRTLRWRRRDPSSASRGRGQKNSRSLVKRY